MVNLNTCAQILNLTIKSCVIVVVVAAAAAAAATVVVVVVVNDVNKSKCIKIQV